MIIKKDEPHYSVYRFDVIDRDILNEIIANGSIGTINLAKNLGISPKGLIHRLKEHLRQGWITTDKIKAKPKGWRRTFEVTKKGKDWIKWYEKKNEEDRLEAELKRDFFRKQKEKK